MFPPLPRAEGGTHLGQRRLAAPVICSLRRTMQSGSTICRVEPDAFPPILHSEAKDGSAAVEHVVAEILHFEDRGIRATLDALRQMRLGDFADDDVMIALLDDA